jgi:hypothetical protein
MYPTHYLVVIQENKWGGLSVLRLSRQVLRIPNCEIIYPRDLIWLLAWCEGGGCGPSPYHIWERGDANVFLEGAVPVPLQVPSHYEEVVWE